MCEHHDHSDSSGVEDFEIQDVAGATLTLVGALVERYIDDEYCDPLMYKALQASRLLATRLAELAQENGDTGTEEQARELVTSFEVTIIEAGELMNEIIERHDLPVLKNTFEVNRNHPKFVERLGEE
jgi:hypothetical protein